LSLRNLICGQPNLWTILNVTSCYNLMPFLGAIIGALVIAGLFAYFLGGLLVKMGSAGGIVLLLVALVGFIMSFMFVGLILDLWWIPTIVIVVMFLVKLRFS
jgi:hypothetical protein